MRLINSKVVSLQVRNFLWKHMHRIYIYEWEDKTNKGRCVMLNGVGQKLWNVLKVFDPGIKAEEIFSLNLRVGHLQADWILANSLFFIANNRNRCSAQSLTTYLLSEFEIFKRSKNCNDDLKMSIQIAIELLEGSEISE